MAFRKILINPIRDLDEHGKLAGLLLVMATVISLMLSNSDFSAGYLKLWDTEIGFSFLHKSIVHWVNDGLMPVFFLLVGIEIKREVISGELSHPRQAILPIAAALGGIMVPALVYFLFTFRQGESMRGWAIPTATDIAFSLGILSLLGSRIPFTLKVFLTALAIIDDLGAILIIAVFYTTSLQLNMLFFAGIALMVMIVMNRFHVRFSLLYLIAGGLLWYFILKSGIHPTIAGVLAAMVIPVSLAESLEHKLDRPVYYFILPLFALANTAIPISIDLAGNFTSTLSLGIIFGLFLGKPIGILLSTSLMIKWKFSDIPGGINWNHLIGMGCLAGIGFTMSLFIAGLSFTDHLLLNTSKLAIIIGSILSAAAGIIILGRGAKIKEEENADPGLLR